VVSRLAYVWPVTRPISLASFDQDYPSMHKETTLAGGF
jgi:hypothetical protein